MTIWFVLLSAGIKTSAFQMSKFRGSTTLSIFSLSTLSNYHYWQSPKTRYWRLVRPYQTGIPPARLLALIWAHNSDLLLKSYHILKHISIPIVSAPIYCIAFRRKCVSFCFLFIIFSIIIYFLSFLCPTERGLLLSLPGVYRHADNASVCLLQK